jgi:general secretion pathway protein I
LSRRIVRKPRRPAAGFTLIETLVALTVVAVMLTAIANLTSVNLKGVRAIGDRVTVVEAARAVTAGLPNRLELKPGILSGAMLGHRWRAEVFPYTAAYVNPQARTPWAPQAVILTVEAPGGPRLRVETVRLRRVALPPTTVNQ